MSSLDQIDSSEGPESEPNPGDGGQVTSPDKPGGPRSQENRSPDKPGGPREPQPRSPDKPGGPR